MIGWENNQGAYFINELNDKIEAVQNSIPEDYTELLADVEDIQSAVSGDSIITDLEFEIGSINVSNGEDATAQNRIRNKGYIELEDFVIYADSGYKFALRFYDADKNYVNTSEVFTTLPRYLKESETYKFFRILIADTSNNTITADEIDTYVSKVHVTRTIADETLSVAGRPADAYAVEQALDYVENKIPTTKSVKILGIGNSYTRDSIRWLWKILKTVGYDNVTVGHGFWGGATLAQEYASLDASDENHSVYQYWKYTTAQDATKTDNQTLNSIIADEPWDFVIFQQQSDEAGQYGSFVSESFDIDDFVSYVKTNINNANLKIGLEQTWSHATGFTSAKFTEYYGGDASVQLEAIEENIPKVADHMRQCDFIVQAGQAIKLGRLNDYLADLGVEMLRSGTQQEPDLNHLEYGIPSFMVGITYALAMLNIDLAKLDWYPDSTDEGHECTTSDYLAYLAKQVAMVANQNY